MVSFLLIASMGHFSWGYGETKLGAARGSRLHPDAATVTFNNFLANGQADSGTWILGFSVKALKDDEDALSMLGGNSDAVVAHGYSADGIVLLAGNANARGVLTVKFDRVGDEVLEKLAQLAFVGHNDGKRLTLDFRGAFLNGDPEASQDPIQYRVAANRRKRAGVSADARES
jgi:hypothetical protein